MKHKIIALFLSSVLAIGLTACGNRQAEQEEGQEQAQVAQEEQAEKGGAGQEGEQGQEQPVPSVGPQQDGSGGSEGQNILIAYFSVPEDVDTSGVDAIAGASIVVKDGGVCGNTEYVAMIVQETIGGDLFRIETTEDYPLDHDPLVDQAAEEQDENARPELKSHIEDLGQYDTVILGFPKGLAYHNLIQCTQP